MKEERRLQFSSADLECNDFAKYEEKILAYWNETRCFEESIERARGRPRFSFYDGPPFATGLPHYGHILSGTVKDAVTRFFYQKGYQMDRVFGWDCHGVPVEHEVNKEIGSMTGAQMEKYGIAQYNDVCRKKVLHYVAEWEETVNRVGRWIDFRNSYKTMDRSFMNSVWSVFGELYRRGFVYRGRKVVAYSLGCHTQMSNFEANLNYREKEDTAVTVKFALKDSIAGEKPNKILAWTTTPWTLPMNMLLLVNRTLDYDVVDVGDEIFVCGKDKWRALDKSAKVLCTVKGAALEHAEYVPIYARYAERKKEGFFRVEHADYVAEDSGTCVVHCAPGFGEEDYSAVVALGLIPANGEVPVPIDEDGNYTDIPEHNGKNIRTAGAEIVALLETRGALAKSEKHVHRYPFCWRSDEPLIYRAVEAWFVAVEKMRDALVAANAEIRWVPENIKMQKFGNWLKDARDWVVSRSRFWGTPIPIWTNADKTKHLCISTAEELQKYTGKRLDDLHREHVDNIVITAGGEEYRRIADVFDCWFESGSMPYAQIAYVLGEDGPCKEKFEASFPADFISEGIDQTRGWFYTLHVLSTALFAKPAFKNAVVIGHVLAADRKKMSKRLKNYPDPKKIIGLYGADALRLFLLHSPVVEGENLAFAENGVREIVKNILIPIKNTLRLYLEIRERAEHTEQESTDPVDLWIASECRELKRRTEALMMRYQLRQTVCELVAFVSLVSNWYVRIQKKRLACRPASVRALGDVLQKFSLLVAPFAPFVAELIFAATGGTERSVHFATGRFSDIARNISEEMAEDARRREEFDIVRNTIEGVRKIREANKISLRTPLYRLEVSGRPATVDALRSMADVISQECNVFDVEFSERLDTQAEVQINPFFAAIKAQTQDAKAVQKKIAAIRSLDAEEISALLEKKRVEKDGIAIEIADVLVRHVARDGGKNCTVIAVGEDKTEQLVVRLDTRVDDSLLRQAEVRELRSHIQKERKRLGMKPADEVHIYVSTPEKGVDIAEIAKQLETLGVGTVSPEESLDGEAHTVKTAAKNVYTIRVKK